MILLDTTTLAEYLAESTAALQAQAVVDALADPVSVKVYDGSGNLKGSGTMATPWASAAAGVITIAEVTGFLVSASGTPDATWYLRFESGTRWLRGGFGEEVTWSLPTWTAGQSGTIGTGIIGVPSNAAPSLVGAPSTLHFSANVGGTYDFSVHKTDPDGDTPLVCSLIGTAYTGITISAAGLLTVTAAATAAVRSLTIRVTDPGGLSSDHACVVTVAASKRWNPGHYIKTQGTDSRVDQSVYWTQVFSEMDKAATFPAMKGAFVNVSWGSFNTTGSTYDWTALDALFAKADSLGQKLIIAITYKNFATAVGLIAPADLRTDHTHSTNSGWISALWRSAVMTRYIAAYQAFATRYGSRSALESVSWSESSPSWASVTPPSDYSNSALSTQLQALATAAVPMFTSSWVHCCMNSLSGELTQMLNNAHSSGAGFSTPDAVDTNAIRLFRGETVSGESTPTHGDLRGRMLHEEIASSPTLGGKDDNSPPSNIINWAQTNKVTHLSWVTSVSIPGNTWADIQSAITADPLLHSAYPTG